MSLADLIKKRGTRKDANANSANVASDKRLSTPPIARIATLALAKTADELVPDLAGDTATTFYWWQFHYADGGLKYASYCSPTTHDEALAGEPDAMSAEPFEPILRPPAEPLTEKEEGLVRTLLDAIGEEDEVVIARALEQCRTDQDAKDAFLEIAKQY
jgi:hypothetical protein